MSKSRINFLQLLRAGHTDYVISGVAREYMAAQKLPKDLLAKLPGAEGKVFADAKQWGAALAGWGVRDERHALQRRLVGEEAAQGLTGLLDALKEREHPTEHPTPGLRRQRRSPVPRIEWGKATP